MRLHFLVFLWGFTGILGKLITLDALPLVWYRLLIAVLCLGIYMGIRKIQFNVSRKQLFQLLSMGALIGVHWYLFFLAIKVSNVSIALATLSTGALFSAILEPFFFKRKIDFFEIGLGLVVIVCMFFLFRVESKYASGIAIGLACTFFSVLFSLFNTKYIRKYKDLSTTKISFYELIGGFIIVWVMLIFQGNMAELKGIETMDFTYLVILGSLLTAFPTIETLYLLKRINPFTLLLTINLEPVYGILMAYFIFPETERLNPNFYIIVVVLIFSIIANEVLKKAFNKNYESEL